MGTHLATPIELRRAPNLLQQSEAVPVEPLEGDEIALEPDHNLVRSSGTVADGDDLLALQGHEPELGGFDDKRGASAMTLLLGSPTVFFMSKHISALLVLLVAAGSIAVASVGCGHNMPGTGGTGGNTTTTTSSSTGGTGGTAPTCDGGAACQGNGDCTETNPCRTGICTCRLLRD